MVIARIRDFFVIVHMDHGTSTLADGILKQCSDLDPRHRKSQYLDTMALEREQGIIMKAQTVCLQYRKEGGHLYQPHG